MDNDCRKLKVHHIGKVAVDIKRELGFYKSLGFAAEKDIYVDKEQKVKVGLVRIGSGVMIELLEPLDDSSPIMAFYKKGGGLHHICYETDDIANEIKRIADKKIGFKLTDITNSIFGKKVVFFANYNRDIFELIEK